MGLSYKKAGVDVAKGNLFVQKIKPAVKSTRIPGTVGSIGGFAGLFDTKRYRGKDSLLVGATDGVGTKLEIAQKLRRHDTVGIDLVAMSANDLVAVGARPLFFLDYFATGKLNVKDAATVVKGIAKGCRQAGCVLLGGETAEMPGFYSPGTYDLAGFAVGIVKQSRLLPRKVAKGDVLVGLASSGPHSNGYSLIRKVFTSRQLKNSVGKQVMKPTVIYVKPILKLLDKIPVSALVHITGGGFLENVPRVLPRGLTARIDSESWPIPELFQKVQVKGKIKKQEMFRTFNMGIGMVAVVRKKDANRSQALLKGQGLKSWIIGEIVKGRKVEIV